LRVLEELPVKGQLQLRLIALYLKYRLVNFICKFKSTWNIH
jgi:hypothetical protein